MNRFCLLYLTFDKLRAGISRCGSRRFSAAVTTSSARETISPSVFLSRGLSLSLGLAVAVAEVDDFGNFLAIGVDFNVNKFETWRGQSSRRMNLEKISSPPSLRSRRFEIE